MKSVSSFSSIDIARGFTLKIWQEHITEDREIYICLKIIDVYQ